MDQSDPAELAAPPALLELERPLSGAVIVSGTRLQGFGWVLAADPVIGITVWLGGQRLGTATVGLQRPDVAEVHHIYPGRSHAGFVFAATVPPLPPGHVDLRLAVDTATMQFSRYVPLILQAAETPESPPGIASLELARAEVDVFSILHVEGRCHGSSVGDGLEVRLGPHLLGFAECAPDGGRIAAPFRFQTLIDPAAICEPVTVTVPGPRGASAARPVLLPPSGAMATVKRPAMMARIDDAIISEHGILSISGWAVCLAEVTDITVYIGDEPLGSAQAFLPRADVGADYPDYPNSKASGFLLRKALTDAQLGGIVRVIVSAVGGITRELVMPLQHPAAVSRRPPARTIEHFVDIASLTESGSLSISGWAVSPAGVAAIGVALGDVALGEASLGGHRPDIGNLFPDIASAPSSGFRFTTDAAPACVGEQIIRLAVRAHDGEERSILQPVLAVAAGPPAGRHDAGGDIDDNLKFHLDLPAIENGRARETVRGFMTVSGWAFARTGAVRIDVFVDGAAQGEAYRGIRREDLQDAFPEWDAGLAGFSMLISPAVLRPGPHDMRLLIRDDHGHHAEISFTVEAEAAAEGPGPWQLRRKMPQAETDLQLAILAAAAVRPRWCLLLPLRRTAAADLAALRATIASLRHQAYPEWTLVVALPRGADAAQLAPALLAGLEDLAPQVSLRTLPPEQTLADLLAGGDMLTVLAAGDRLGEDALLELAVESAVRPQSDFFYSDERRIDPADGAMRAFFKPDWSPDLLLSTNYIGRLWAARGSLLRRSGLRLGSLDRSGEYDAVLRLCEQASRIAHVRKVLCERGGATFDSPARERLALLNAARRHDLKARILPGCLPGTWRFKRDIVIPKAADSPGLLAGPIAGMVSIIIPSIASRGLIETTISSIRGRTAWPSYEIIVLDNIHGTDDPARLSWKQWMRAHADRVIEIDEAFNWSRFNNIGAAAARGDYLLFLNDDIEVLEEDWLHGLIEHAQRPEVGVVGPQLLYPDGRVQHAGVFLGRSVGRHAFRFYPGDAPGPFGLARTQRNVISVTGACMMVRRAVFAATGGFDEAHPVINNDLDFALRAQAAGRLVVYTPHVRLIHHEMVSRAVLKDVFDSATFDAAWKDRFLQGDPYFHPTLSLEYDDYQPESEPLRQFQVGHPLIAADRVHRILAVKVDHIGDFIAAFPAFRRLKQHFPNAELCVLAARASLALAPLEPAIDRVMEFNFFHARSELGRLAAREAELAALEQRLLPERFDLAIDLRRQSDTRPILRHSGARWLAGFDQDHGLPWLDIAIEFEGDVARTFKRSHVTASLVQLVDAVGSACQADRAVARPPASMAQARAAVACLPAVAAVADRLYERPVVCVHTGAGATNKQWPAASFSGLIDLLVGHAGVNVMIIGGPDEADLAAEVISTVRRPAQVFSLIGAVGLRDLPALLLTSVLYVGNDSGPKHMAAAVGVPTIGIHSGSVDAGEWGPMGPATLTIRRDMICGPCYIALASDCPRGMACLHGIKIGEVYQACQRLLLLRQPAARRLDAAAEPPSGDLAA